MKTADRLLHGSSDRDEAAASRRLALAEHAWRPPGPATRPGGTSAQRRRGASPPLPRLVAASQVLALQDAERRRIARDLHDCTVQDIAAAVIELDHVAFALPAACCNAALGRARTLLSRSLEDLRTLSYTLHPPLLDEFGFATALETFAEGFARLRGLVCDISVDRDAARVLPPEIAVALIRVAQEAFANAHRHGRATRLTLRFRAVMSRGVELHITDNGAGFVMRAREDAAKGVGIPGMQARMRQLGGKLRIASHGNGTLVVAQAPLRRTSRRGAGILP